MSQLLAPGGDLVATLGFYSGHPQVHLSQLPAFSAFSQESQQKVFSTATLQSQPLWAHFLVFGIVVYSSD